MTEPFGPWRDNPASGDDKPSGPQDESRALLPVDAPYLEPAPPVTHSPAIHLD